MVACVLVVTSLFATSAWLIVRETGDTGVSPPPETREEAITLSNQRLDDVFPGYTADNSTLSSNLTSLLTNNTAYWDEANLQVGN
jgi:hypothetical protein